MPIAPSLQRFVDDELSRAPALIAQTLDGVFERLRGPHDRELQLVLQQRSAIYRAAFVDALRTRVQDELAREDGGGGMAPPSGLGGLALMDESRVEIDIEISRATQTIDAAAEWELRELQTYTSTLIGQAHVSTESNPLRPTLYAAALWDAGCAVLSAHAQRAALLRLAAPACAARLKLAWAAASTRLERQGVTPSQFRTVVLAPSAVPTMRPSSATNPHGTTPTAGHPDRAASAADAMRRLLAALPASVAGRSASRSAGSTGASASGTGGSLSSIGSSSRARDDIDAAARSDRGRSQTPATPPVAEPGFEAALARLDDILQQLPARAVTKPSAAHLHRQMATHREALAAHSRASDERQAIALLSQIFDALLVDPQLSPAFIVPVARLQVSALRAAMRDPSATDSVDHPLWQLLERIGEASASYPIATDPRAVALAGICQRLADGLVRSTVPDADLFGKALARLDEFLAAQLQAQLQAAASAVAELRDAEALAALQEQVSQRLAEQMRGQRPTATVRRFVLGSWSRVIATAMLRFGDDSPVTRSHVAGVDDLLWSVQSPDHPASRQRLAALIPGLLQRLRAGMALVALPQPEQRAILDELGEIHTAALRAADGPDGARPTAPAVATAARWPSMNAGSATGPAEPTTSGDALGLADADADADSTVDRLIDWTSLDTVPADLMPQGQPAAGRTAPAQQVAALRPPQRQRMFIHGRWARVQLLWRSDRGGFFLFAGETAGQTHSITRSALERLAAVQLLAPLEAQSLMERALASVSRQLTKALDGAA